MLDEVVNVTVKIRDDNKAPRLCPLDLNKNLSNIREELKNEHVIDETFLFSKKEENEFSEIVRGYEDKILLKDIVHCVKPTIYHLYFTKNQGPNWEDFNNKFRLDHGCTMSSDGIKKVGVKRISSRAF